ncbi:MAG: acyltransferase family protein, partial [Pseudomonadota bacterium]
VLVVLASYAIGQACTGDTCLRAYDVTSENLADHLLLRSGVSVLWTIPVEMKFYALFLVFWAAFALNRALGAALVIGLLALYWLREPGTMPVMKLGHYFLIGLGVWIAWGLVIAKGSDRLWNGLFLLAGFALLASLPQPFIALHGHQPRMWWEPQIAVAAALMLLTAARSPLGQRVLSAAPLRWLGAISYSLYLTHMLVLMNLALLLDPAAAPLVFYALALALSLGLAALSTVALERPVQTWLRETLARRPAATPRLEATS